MVSRRKAESQRVTRRRFVPHRILLAEFQNRSVPLLLRIEAIVQNAASQQHYLGMLLSVARSLERIADHATHIAEDVLYMLQGQIIRHAAADSHGREGG